MTSGETNITLQFSLDRDFNSAGRRRAERRLPGEAAAGPGYAVSTLIPEE